MTPCLNEKALPEVLVHYGEGIYKNIALYIPGLLINHLEMKQHILEEIEFPKERNPIRFRDTVEPRDVVYLGEDVADYSYKTVHHERQDIIPTVRATRDALTRYFTSKNFTCSLEHGVAKDVTEYRVLSGLNCLLVNW